MDDKQKLGLKIGMTSLLLLVVALGVYFVNDISKGGSQTLTTRASQVSPNLSLVSPKAGETLKGKGSFEAKLKTNKDIKNLKGVYKIGEGQTWPLNLRKLDDSNILVDGEITAADNLRGQYFVKVYIYEASGSGVAAIATADFPIFIDNP